MAVFHSGRYLMLDNQNIFCFQAEICNFCSAAHQTLKRLCIVRKYYMGNWIVFIRLTRSSCRNVFGHSFVSSSLADVMITIRDSCRNLSVYHPQSRTSHALFRPSSPLPTAVAESVDSRSWTSMKLAGRCEMLSRRAGVGCRFT